MKKILICCILSFFAFACSSIKGEYVLTNEEFKSNNISINFDKERLYGNSGINYYNSYYKIDKNNINIGIVTTTLMAGEIENLNLEQKYLDFLQNAIKIEKDKDKLIIITKNNYKLIFKKKR